MGILEALFGIFEPALRQVDAEKTGGKIFGTIDNKMGEIQNDYNRKVSNVESYKKRFQGYPNNRLAEIAKNGNNSFEMRTGAMEVLKERGAFNK